MVYLDNAATSWPKPEAVYQTMDRFLREAGGNPGRAGHSLAVRAAQAIERTRALVAQLVHAPSEADIVFTLNCTDALNLAIKGLLRPGDHVVTSSISHNSIARPIHALEHRGVRVTRLAPELPNGAVSAGAVAAALEPTTRLVALTHASNVTGLIQPVEEVGAVTRARGVAFLVDAAQSLGVVPVDVQAASIDLLAFPGHKSLLGPTGTGGLYVRGDLPLEPIREGGTGTSSESPEQPMTRPSRYESGTPNTVGIAGLGEGLRYVLDRGVEAIREHETALVAAMLDGLAEIEGVDSFGPADPRARTGIVSFRIRGWEPGEVGTILDQAFDIKVRTGLHCAPAAHRVLGTMPRGTIRASVGSFNTMDDVLQLVEAVRSIAAAPPATL